MFNPFKKDKTEDKSGGPGPEGAGDAAAGDGAGGEIEAMRAEVAQLRAELGQAQDDRQRALADYVNFQRRSVQNERDAREAGVRGVLHSVLPVLDHFDMALAQDPSTASAASVIHGVTMIKDELVRALGLHGVGLVRPARGDAFDPLRHKAIAQLPGGEVAPGHVHTLARVGFTLGDRVVRPAEVVVAAGAGGDEVSGGAGGAPDAAG
jgi:molecular chaperone GrpE